MKRSYLLGSTLILALTAQIASAATVTADFSVTNQSLFGSSSAAAFNGSVGIGSNSSTFQFRAETGASSGTVSSEASVAIDAAFQTSQEIGVGNVKLSFGGASAEFDTALGAFINVGATVRTPAISVPFAPDIPAVSLPFDLVDEDYQLDAAARDSTYSFGQTLSDDDSVSLPGTGAGVGITVSANPNVDQTSTLDILGVNATLFAVNQSTGTILSDAFFFDGSMESIDLNFSEEGIWDLTLQNLSLASRFDSVFGLSATFAGGASIGLGCGNPARDSDNGTFCLWDAGVETTTPTANLLSISPFSLNYNTVASLSLGAVNVAAPETMSAVPIPASLPMLLSALGLVGWTARRRATSRA